MKVFLISFPGGENSPHFARMKNLAKSWGWKFFPREEGKVEVLFPSDLAVGFIFALGQLGIECRFVEEIPDVREILNEGFQDLHRQIDIFCFHLSLGGFPLAEVA